MPPPDPDDEVDVFDPNRFAPGDVLARPGIEIVNVWPSLRV
jgi:hypothetical protein